MFMLMFGVHAVINDFLTG